MSVTKTPILSISILVSNGRKDTIKKCMESLLPLRMAVPSELILVDTGCTDGSIEIAKEYADKVVKFTWCDDFAAARNAGLEICTGEWFMFIDDDEWFEDVSEIIGFFQSGEYKKYGRATYIARNYVNMAGTDYQDSMAGRLCRLTPGLRFIGRLHEYLPTDEGDMYYFSCFVHHYGYAYATEEERKRHTERNFSLLKKMIEEEPENIRAAAHLLQEYMGTGNYEEAEKLCKRSLEICRRKRLTKKTLFYEYLVLALIEIYRLQERFLEAEKEHLRICEEEPLTKFGLTKLWAERCFLEEERGNEKAVLEAVRMYVILYEDKTNRGVGTLDLLYYSTPSCFREILKIGCSTMLSKKEFSYADFIFSRVNWEEKQPIPYEWVEFLQRYLVESSDIDLYCKYSEKAMQVPELKEVFIPSLQTMIEKHPEKEVLFTEAVKRLRQPKANPELKALGEQMRRIIETQIASGNKTEAKTLLLEVEGMLPGEEWIWELKKKI